MSRSAHVVLLLFTVATALYFVFKDDNIREWMITIIMSVGVTILTIISTGGVIFIQNRQDRVYKRVQRKFHHDSYDDHDIEKNGKHLKESPPTTTNNEKSQQKIKSFLEEEFSNDPHYEPLKQHSLTPDDDHIDDIISVKDINGGFNHFNVKPSSNPNGSPSDQVNNKSMIGGAMTSEKISVLTNSFSPRSGRDWKTRSKRSISKSIIEADAQGRLELAQVITNPKLLNVFAQFLCVEFNCENLLFIIEIVQFKRYIKENDNDCSSILGEYLSIPQHEDLPKFDYHMDEESFPNKSVSQTGASSDPNNENRKKNGTYMVDVYMYALYIVNKYIKTDGSHEINIPGRVRDKIIKQATNDRKIRQLDMEKLQVLFDDAFIEILALLQDPLSRFSSWEEFNSYLKAIAPTAYPFLPRCKDCCKCCCIVSIQNERKKENDDQVQLLKH